MFNNETNKKTRKGASTTDFGVTILTNGCTFVGKLYCKGSSRIAGTVDGDIISEGFLVIEEEANINANIVGDNIVIHGAVTGVITAKQRLEMTESSSFEGNLNTPVLIVKEGAQFNGTALMAKSMESVMKNKIKEITESPNSTFANIHEVVPEVSVE